MTTARETALEPAFSDGRLREHHAGWRWMDGTPEPRVGLLPARRAS